ncbi:hypothetical protein [Achromobacter marplatensis]|uniref:Uncharacterized protein n=1 Tax=Achromobacter marplatensis TaxID=470868 RepID=A0AA43B0G3_9BURK|nr:hypothetical protein [Achromobacter marplatensis]MDH2053376.1 hypothetical protein [Achromobacter marplatensis]
MSNSNWPEAVAVSSVAAATAWILTPWDKIGPINWDAVAAVGTLAAVAVALAVPLWQSWDRRREQARAEALEEWVAMQGALRLFDEVRHCLEDWANNLGVPSPQYIQALIDDLLAAKSSVKSPSGGIVLGEFAGVARRLRKSAESSANSPSSLMQGLDGKFERIELAETMRNCNQLQSVWAGEVMRRVIRTGAIKVLPK